MSKTKDIPFSRMHIISESGVFVKHFRRAEKTAMKSYAHRDDYYMIVLLTDGYARVEVDLEKLELKSGEILVVSPWQVHGKPTGENWDADGWLLGFSPEILSEKEIRTAEEYSISPRPFSPGESTIKDIVVLCAMLEKNKDNESIAGALGAAVKSIVLVSLVTTDKDAASRYRSITTKLRKLLETHLTTEKSPAAYASMLNISEVYLNEAVKGATGLSAGGYIRSRAIVQAKRQLAYTSLTAKEIAFALGYDDYAYFSKLFKKYTGKSPAEYRRNLK